MKYWVIMTVLKAIVLFLAAIVTILLGSLLAHIPLFTSGEAALTGGVGWAIGFDCYKIFKFIDEKYYEHR